MKTRKFVILLVILIGCWICLSQLYIPFVYKRTRLEMVDAKGNGGVPSFYFKREKGYSWLPGPETISQVLTEQEFGELRRKAGNPPVMGWLGPDNSGTTIYLPN